MNIAIAHPPSSPTLPLFSCPPFQSHSFDWFNFDGYFAPAILCCCYLAVVTCIRHVYIYCTCAVLLSCEVLCVCVACELSVSHALTTFILQNGLVDGVGRALLSCARVVMFVDLLGIQRMPPRIWGGMTISVLRRQCMCLCEYLTTHGATSAHTPTHQHTHVHIFYSWYISRHCMGSYVLATL